MVRWFQLVSCSLASKRAKPFHLVLPPLSRALWCLVVLPLAVASGRMSARPCISDIARRWHPSEKGQQPTLELFPNASVQRTFPRIEREWSALLIAALVYQAILAR
jgi:hypothetical protein